VDARIEEGNKEVCKWIKRADIRPLVPITTQTRQGEIVLVGFPTMLKWDDMVRLVLMKGDSLGQ
jgi:hypothetical protein